MGMFSLIKLICYEKKKTLKLTFWVQLKLTFMNITIFHSIGLSVWLMFALYIIQIKN